jgi:hypothetical protein
MKSDLTVHLLDGLFRQDSRLSGLFQRQNSVCYILSFVSSHRNLVIAVHFASVSLFVRQTRTLLSKVIHMLICAVKSQRSQMEIKAALLNFSYSKSTMEITGGLSPRILRSELFG